MGPLFHFIKGTGPLIQPLSGTAVANPIECASVVVRHEDRAIWQIDHVYRSGQGATRRFIQESVCKHFCSARIAVCFDRHKVEQVARWGGTVPGAMRCDKQTALVLLGKRGTRVVRQA